MAGNPKESKWRSALQEDRKSKVVGFTLSEEVRARLDLLTRGRNRSEFIAALILAAPLPEKKR